MSKFTKVLAGALVLAFVAATSSSAAMTWSRSLKLGARGADVKDLQMFLNMCADTKVSMSGAGSPGMETTTFGPATKAAVIKWQAARGVSPASGLFGPLSRAKAAELQASSNVCGGGVVVNPPAQTGPVSATLAATTPAAGYIVNSQASAGLLDIQFSGSGVVNSVTLKRSGISDQNTLTNVYLYEGNTRLTDGYSFNSNGEIMMNNLGIMVSGSKIISVKADAASNANTSSTIAVALTSFSAGATVSTVNVQGNMMNLAAGSSLASASLSANTVSSATVNAGTSAYTFWSAPVQVNTRALNLKSAAFRMIGSAPSDALANIRLFVDGLDTGKVASVTSIQGTNYAVFDFGSTPLSLSTGSHTVAVRADIVKGSSRTVSFSLQQAADLMITDPQVGVNVAVSGTVPSNAGTVTIGSGSLTASVDPSFLSMINVTGGASNVAIAKYKVRAYGEDVKVNSLQVLPVLGTMTPAAAGLQNVTVYFNGSQVGTQTASWSSGAITLNLGSQMIIPAGVDSFIEVKADLRTTGSVNYTAGTVSANLVVGSSNAQGQSSYTTISTPAVSGNSLTVQTGLLGLAANSGYASQNANPNTANVKIGSFVLQNQSSSESVRITNLAVALTVGAGTSLTNFGALKTSENAAPVQPQATNNFSVDFTIAPNATKIVDIFADAGADAGSTATIQTALTVSSIGVSSNVSATSASTSGQTITFRTGTLATPTLTASSSSTAQLVAAANGGASDGSKAVYNFTSSNASSTITKLTFGVTSGTATSIKINGVSYPVVGSTVIASGLNLVVPLGGSGLNVEVFVSYPEVGSSGVASTTTSALTLSGVEYSSGGVAQTPLTPTVAAPTMTLVGSMPALAIADSSDTLLNGSVKLAEITVSANAKGDIKLGKLPVLVNSTGVATIASGTDNIVVKDTSGNTIATTNATFAVAAGGSATGVICFDTAVAACASGSSSANAYLIPAGTSKTFRIYATAATVSGAVNTTSLSSKLGAATSLSWYDAAGANTTAINGALIYGYPTETSVISN